MDLTKGNTFKTMIIFSIPFILSNHLQTFYGMADLFIVGQYNTASSLTGVSIGSQVMHMITVMIIALAMSSTIMIGKYVGENNQTKIKETIINSIILFMTISLIITIILFLNLDNIISLMLTPKEAIKETTIYLKICFSAIPIITLYNLISAILRGLGNSKQPMYYIAISCIINIILDYILIGYFNMHALGAALATVIAQTISVIIALLTTKLPIKIIKPSKIIIKDLLHIGIPICIQDGLIQISFIIITMIANSRGIYISSAVGVVEKIITFFFLVPSSMLSSISAMASQCLGNKQPTRAKQTLLYGIMIALSFGILFAFICQLFDKQIISLFTNEVEVIHYGRQYLKAYVFDCVFAAISFSFSGYFMAYGYSMISFIHNIISIVLIRVPGAYLASIIYPENLFYMGLTPALGSLLSAIICISIYLCLKKKKIFV